MEVKMLTPEDAKSYWELRLEALQLNPEAFLTTYEEAAGRENPIEQTTRNLAKEGNFTFGAFEDTVLIGMVTLLCESHEKLQHRANIYAMYVKPVKRKLGVGKALISAAIEQAKTLTRIEKINLTVNACNESAKRLYSAFGFKTFGYEERSLKYAKNYYDEEHMVLSLIQ